MNKGDGELCNLDTGKRGTVVLKSGRPSFSRGRSNIENGSGRRTRSTFVPDQLEEEEMEFSLPRRIGIRVIFSPWRQISSSLKDTKFVKQKISLLYPPFERGAYLVGPRFSPGFYLRLTACFSAYMRGMRVAPLIDAREHNER